MCNQFSVKSIKLSFVELNSEPTVEVLYSTRAIVGEGLFYEEETGQLLWVDIEAKTVNFLNIDSGENR